ncbi:hypothetical protein ACFWOL_09170 [Streptomyces sp. NPDC058442]|uniref:hypothetical protein n=1 Tax=Streptomyces sp. NPDC058442 TaxID=3346503 RepID=UPI0036548DC8
MNTPDQVLDVGRFTGRVRWLVVGALLVLWLVLLHPAIPAAWSLLDRAEVLGAAAAAGTSPETAGDAACTRLCTAACAVSICPALAGVALHLLWRTRHIVEERFTTSVLLTLAALVTAQTASVAAGWGDQHTGRAIQEELDDTGISLWAGAPPSADGASAVRRRPRARRHWPSRSPASPATSPAGSSP